MEIRNSSMKYELNATELQNEQNRSNIQETTTWCEWGYKYFVHGKTITNIYHMSKFVSPQHTIRQIATYGVVPLTRRIDCAIGCPNTNINVLGYQIPCSFSSLGTLATEALTITTSPAQWAAYKTVNFISSYFANKVISDLNLESKGALGREVAAAIQISSSLIGQKALEEIEKNEMVTSTYKKVDDKLKCVSKPIDKFVHKQISKGLNKLGIDSSKPLGLTQSDIERERNLLASEEKVRDIEEEIQTLNQKERMLQEQVAHQEQNDLDADKIIQKAREYEKHCPEKMSEPKYKKHKKFKKVWAKNISEQFVSEYNISEEQRSDMQEEIVRRLHNPHGEKEHNKAMKEVIVKYKTMLQNKSKIKLDDVKRAQTKMQCKLVKAKEQYKSYKRIFDEESDAYQQAKYRKEQQERNELRVKQNSTTANSNSGNIQFTISSQELKQLETLIYQYMKKNEFCKINIDNYEVFIDEVNLVQNSLGNLGLKVPIKIHDEGNLFTGKVTKFNADLYFNIEFADSSPNKIIDINIDATHKLRNKPHYKLFSVFQVMRVGSMTNEKLTPSLNEAVSQIQASIDSFLLKDNVLNKFNENLPKEVSINPGIINVRPRIDNSNNQVFDIDFNADFEHHISAESLRDVFTGYSVGNLCLEKIHNIEMTAGRVKIEIPVSGAINGSVVSSFDLIYCPERQRFSFNNLEVSPQNDASLLINYFSTAVNYADCLKNGLLGLLESYLNNNFENIRLSAIKNVQQRFQEEIPGSLVIDDDSITINNINCDNNEISLDLSLRSINYLPNQN